MQPLLLVLRLLFGKGVFWLLLGLALLLGGTVFAYAIANSYNGLGIFVCSPFLGCLMQSVVIFLIALISASVPFWRGKKRTDREGLIFKVNSLMFGTTVSLLGITLLLVCGAALTVVFR